MARPKNPGRILKDKDIMEIMQAHQGFRNAIRQHAPDAELMSDETFLERLHEIVPEGKRAIIGTQVSDIYRLRSEYEALPPSRNGQRPNYSPEVIRLQVNTGLLNKLSSEELKEVFGTPRTQESWYWLAPVLERPLGRWTADRRNLTGREVRSWFDEKEEEDAAVAAY